MEHNSFEEWNSYVLSEQTTLLPILTALGYELDEFQPHLSGERYLMQAVTTTHGRKLILLGKEPSTGMRVVIKATRDAEGKQELLHERACRAAIHSLPFAYHTFTSPKELFFGARDGILISIQEYIEQSSAFLDRPLTEQFTYGLGAFKAQEGAHAATYEQRKSAERVFGSVSTQEYIRTFQKFKEQIHSNSEDTELRARIDAAHTFITAHSQVVEQYGNFLTHTDFVPHNFRIRNGILYLLDYSSLRFGNKHEGWARFLNFMTLYNPELEEAFVSYFKDNRAPEELDSLQTMRIYRLGEIIWYYLRSLPKSTGDLHALNFARVSFWSDVMHSQLHNNKLPSEIREIYIATRDRLRSDDERKRQKDLH